MITTDERHGTLLALYPLFKEEVYRRRHEMMRWTAFGSAGSMAMLLALLLSPHASRLTSLETLLAGLAGLIWCGLFCALIRQQENRHRQAKQVLIHLEQALNLYAEGIFVEDHSLYPQTWASDWTRDKTGLLYYGTLGTLTALVLLALVIT
ncbi:MAG: hypothetical protein RI101_00545 [Nitrospira sp.]|jgi:hypothetical protein|nr:hypothetical protein [Nitrospira sp.]